MDHFIQHKKCLIIYTHQMKIDYKKSFSKSYNKLDKSIQFAFDTKLLLFEKDPIHPMLRNHALSGEYLGFRSINITGDVRAIFQELSDNTYEFVEFVDIGTHSQLY